ncbi:MAG: SsrA-binding protein SmpB [Saccharofermentans sp.]|jgi:SsrA-binding protein|nr:SsrA-binding protein SmpB [Mageeibacillus sp.]MCI1264043.1 SsrA-binding protein SmpB [Saccharofermentans sp.]MCI1275441.1 SsrA-binding protein SmpB [Saccharofermentans sp.]MCI1769604.1 SsrA-binding protein SmpB [Mageeibacillus sp.]MCI2044031.1 SsrA-binding protein SmpB [Mageeibacillus sp.]
MPVTRGIKLIAENRKAFHDYFVEERFECGIVLSGTEVKSLRAGRVNLKDSYCQVKDSEMYLIGVHISPYEQGNRYNLDPMRTRKLLMHKNEIIKLYSKTKISGETLVPTKLYFKDGKVKCEIGLAKGKKDYDKRDTIAKKEAQRDIERAMKTKSRD